MTSATQTRQPTSIKDLLNDQQLIKKELYLQQQPLPPARPTTLRQIKSPWLEFSILNAQQKAWESLNVWRAKYLYGIRNVEITRSARVSKRTLEYFLHAPNRVGYQSATKIILATKLVMSRAILWYEEDYNATWERWNSCDPRIVKANHRIP